jgi:hypothetical protein
MSSDAVRDLLLENIVSTVKGTQLHRDHPPIDRTTTNAWEDAELQRDWAREESVAEVVEIVLIERLLTS